MAGITSNMPALANVYNYYLTSYGPQSTGRYDTHKKSELRGVYNSIVKLSKDSPLYLVEKSPEARDFVVDIKENARLLRNTIASMGGTDAGNVLSNKVAYSTDDDTVAATFIGTVSEGESIPDLAVEVASIASPQENTGYALPEGIATLKPDAYSFDVRLRDTNYEFHFNVNEGETNQDIQYRLKRLINNAKIGINADVLTGEDGSTALRITSSDSGAPYGDRDTIFELSDDHTSKASGSLEYLGIDYISKYPSDAVYRINGEIQSSSSNRINYEGIYELEFGRASDSTVHVGLMTDVESLSSNITKLVGGYNDFLAAAAQHTGSTTNGMKLTRELTGIARSYRDTLLGVGMDMERDGSLSVDENALMTSALDEEAPSRFSGVRDFTASLLRKSNQISLDPMTYVNQKVVAYKNPFAKNNYPNPYITSAYSGMLFNSYC